MTPQPEFDCFAVAAPGLEPLVARELTALGLSPTVEPGGASWRGNLESVWRANLWLRTASRVVVRLAEFRARGFPELERHAARVEWERYVAPDVPVAFRVTSKKSRLYHTEGIAERLTTGLRKRLGRSVEARVAGDEDDGAPDEAAAQLFVVRVHRDVVTISADSSGELLHRRGYRQAVGKAPLRETLAAALLMSSEWPVDVPLMDPMCGSGTIPIEAAMMARQMPPGRARNFAFERWPGFDRQAWQRLRAAALAQELASSPVSITGSDRDAGAIAAARANAERAGVAADATFLIRPVSAMSVGEGPGVGGDAPDCGWLVSNPPYGVRVGESGALRDLFAQLGHVLRARFAGWTVALLSPDVQLDSQLGLPLTERLRTVNGGIGVRVVSARVP